MQPYRSVLILIALLPAALHAADLLQLTPEQKQQAMDVGARVEKQCLQGGQAPANASRFVQSVIEWSKDPALCSCVGKKVTAGMTAKVFLYNESAARQWLSDTAFTASMECSVPVVKEKFAAACVSLFADAFKAGSGADAPQPNFEQYCACARDNLNAISTKEWVESSMQNYNAYLERKRKGEATPPPQTPLNSAIEKCTADLAK